MQMRVFLVFRIALCLEVASIFSTSELEKISTKFNDSFDSLFSQFIIQHKKLYSSPFESQYRKQIFAENIKHLLTNELDQETQLGINKFTDLTFEEFSEKYLLQQEPTLFKPSSDSSSDSSQTPQPSLLPPKRNRFLQYSSTPPRISWKQFSPPIPDQRDCAACWAFAASSAVHVAASQSNGNFPVLSTQEILDCYSNRIGCVGGNPLRAIDYFIRRGARADKEYPFEERVSNCRRGRARIFRPRARFRVVRPNAYAVVEALAEGPVTILHVANRDLKDYVRGILRPKNCGGKLNHSATIVGYDLTARVPYFEFINAWGADFGENGFYRMAIGPFNSKGYCRIFDHEYAAVVIPT